MYGREICLGARGSYRYKHCYNYRYIPMQLDYTAIIIILMCMRSCYMAIYRYIAMSLLSSTSPEYMQLMIWHVHGNFIKSSYGWLAS